MNGKTKSNSFIIYMFILFVLLTAGAFIANICIGSVSISFADFVSSITDRNNNMTTYRIIMDIRLPRAIAAAIIGGALSVSGFLLQTFFRNPIAGPFILGISSGAKLIVAITMVFSMSLGISYSAFGMIFSAFIGALLSMGLVLCVSTRVNRMSVLIICGVMIGYICSAITDFIVTFADDSNIVNLHSWSLGSFAGTSWGQIKCMAVIVVISVIMSFFLSKPMSAYQMSDSYAGSLGINLKLLRIVLILLSSVLSATVTAFAGPISFVGVAVPHLVKSVLKSSKPILIIPGCFIGGGFFCLICDLIARTLFSPTEISISSITALFGAPVVIYLMLKRSRRN